MSYRIESLAARLVAAPQGPIDQERHKEKIKEAIKKNLADIVSEESIILSDGKKVVKVPIRSLEEYRFRYDSRPAAARRPGRRREPGGRRDRAASRGPGEGRRGEAGEEPGVDYYEAEVTVDELAALIFEDLGLPNLEEKKLAEMETEAVRFTDVRKDGPLANLDKRRTIMENIKRNAAKGDAALRRRHERRSALQDLGADDRVPVERRRDRDDGRLGSMGEFEKYIARSFYFWMVRFLRTKYDNVKIVFITHHTEAKEVTEEEFFTHGESGGTQVSSAYELALQIIDERYNPDDWNIYPFHFSDGDNLPWDNERCVELVQQLMRAVQHLRLRRDPRGALSLAQHADVRLQQDRGPEVHRGDDRRQGGGLSGAAPLLRHARSEPATP